MTEVLQTVAELGAARVLPLARAAQSSWKKTPSQLHGANKPDVRKTYPRMPKTALEYFAVVLSIMTDHRATAHRATAKTLSQFTADSSQRSVLPFATVFGKGFVDTPAMFIYHRYLGEERFSFGVKKVAQG
jgi:hypothetical protein